MSIESTASTDASTMADSRVTVALEEALNRGEVGIQVAAYLNGRLIVNAVAGRVADGDALEATTDTLFPVFSVTKAVVATGLHLLAKRGLVDYTAPVATYWPEFAQNGKGDITVRHALSHRAGIPWMPPDIGLDEQADWSWVIKRIEEEEPTFPAGSVNCYHALVWGWIIGEIIRRTDPQQRDLQTFIRQEIIEPLAIEDMYLGLPSEQDRRVATLLAGEVPTEPISEYFLRGMPPAIYPGSVAYNTEKSRRTVNPGAGIIANASSMARFFGALANGGELDGTRLFTCGELLTFTAPRDNVDDVDIYMGRPVRVGAYGYWVGGGGPGLNPLVGEDLHILYHTGAGGSIAWAELDTGLSIAFCHNAMHGAIDPDRHPFTPAIEAVRAIAAELRETHA
ncbi:serine hydrolase domain-containing protein [Micromonospora sp. NPDC005206]|uniref:serine hydrolase domain-containing protein n=1 Tax=Micromonospora sp. NPDC005206 TaxID=3157022 RepID=UPI0033B1FA43